MRSEYKDCQYFFEGKCRCMDSSFNQDFYECPQCRDVSYCYYKQLKKYEQEIEELKEDIKNSPLCYMCKEEDCLKKQLKRCEQKLEKIKEFCNYCSNVEHSGCALCKYDCEEPTAFILSIVEGAENEN